MVRQTMLTLWKEMQIQKKKKRKKEGERCVNKYRVEN